MYAMKHNLKFYPKLKLFKNSNGTNTFDGKVAISYGYYVYAIVLSDGRTVEVEKSPSPTTSGHMSAFSSVSGRDYTKTLRVKGADSGLQNLVLVRRGIESEIAELEAELQNKRNRNVEGRKARIAILQEQLQTVNMIKTEFNTEWVA